MKKYFFISLVILFHSLSFSQNLTQTIRGTIVDKETQLPIEFSTVLIYKDSTLLKSASSDAQGQFVCKGIPVGRVKLMASFVGYKKMVMQNIIVSSSKEIILQIELESSVLNEINVSANKKHESINEMALISSHVFTVEETQRYAGSRGDPARMATNFAGVNGTDDSRNDIVIRGNSPFGVLYRLENVNIPNPTHFAVAGSTGGPVGMLCNRMLANSDFMTGAFAAEYGNANAGVFDLRYKNGNDKNYEGTFQFGALGAEAYLEGPISKKNKSSFVFNYRYATLQMLVAMGIDIGTKEIPKYQDFQFKLNFPQKKGGSISIFGLGGLANVNLNTSKQKTPTEREIYSTKDQDEQFRTRMGVVGLSYTRPVNEKTFAKMTFAVSTQYLQNQFQRVVRHIDSSINEYVVDSMYDKMYYRFQETKITGSFFRNTKVNSNMSIRYGLITDAYLFTFIDSNFNENTNTWTKRYQTKNALHYLFQPYLQTKINMSSRLSMTAGIHIQWFTLNNSWSLEPRASFKYQIRSNQNFTIGFGIHSQMQPTYIYFQQKKIENKDKYYLPNKNLDFTRALHTVVGYDITFKKDVRIKVEAYYQKLDNIPIDTNASSYSVINEGSSFDRFFPNKLVNRGSARNYGIELTVEKFFTHNWFIMFSGSLFDSKYRGSDGVLRNTSFNSKYVMNLLGTKEFHWGKKRKNMVSIGGKITYGGGRVYSPYDATASLLNDELTIIDAERNTKIFPDYFRFDMKLNYVLNTKKNITHEIGIDLVNLTGQKNVLRLTYTGGVDPVRQVNQLGFLPLFYYKLDFSFAKKEPTSITPIF
jgi:hypothetical protein